MNKLIIIAVFQINESTLKVQNEIKELKLLSENMGYKVSGEITQKRLNPDPKFYMGKGKIESIIIQAEEINCKTILVNDELSSLQAKTLEKAGKKKITFIDRTRIILNIFKDHARTKEAKKQVQLAELQYLLPRLTRMWTHLERQAGGIGLRGGPGETQIEIDRRIISKKIYKLKKEINNIDKQKKIQQQNRSNSLQVTLTGYTNSGKSTLMNMMTGSDVYTKNQLFATLDTTTRRLDIPFPKQILISDTVGFMQKLPHELLESFKTTLKQVSNSHLVLRVFDASSENLSEQMDTVSNVLKDIKANKITYITVMNKIDKIDATLLKNLIKRYPQALFISALKNLKINALIESIKSGLKEKFTNHLFRLPHSYNKIISYIYQNTHVVKRNDDYKGVEIIAQADRKTLKFIKDLIDKKIRKRLFSDHF